MTKNNTEIKYRIRTYKRSKQMSMEMDMSFEASAYWHVEGKIGCQIEKNRRIFLPTDVYVEIIVLNKKQEICEDECNKCPEDNSKCPIQ